MAEFNVGDLMPDGFNPANCGCAYYAEEGRLCPHDIQKLFGSKQFEQGDRVNTPSGSGSIIYKRMSGPNYIEVAAYSVCLDSRKAESDKPPFPSYSETVFPAEQVTKI